MPVNTMESRGRPSVHMSMRGLACAKLFRRAWFCALCTGRHCPPLYTHVPGLGPSPNQYHAPPLPTTQCLLQEWVCCLVHDTQSVSARGLHRCPTQGCTGAQREPPQLFSADEFRGQPTTHFAAQDLLCTLLAITCGSGVGVVLFDAELSPPWRQTLIWPTFWRL